MTESNGLTLNLSSNALELIAKRCAEIVLDRLGRQLGSPWMTRAEAAEYLGWPLSRGVIPAFSTSALSARPIHHCALSME